MSGLLMPPPAPMVPQPPPAPTLDNAKVQAAADQAAQGKAGRASTFMTDPSTQLTAGPSKKQYLSGEM